LYKKKWRKGKSDRREYSGIYMIPQNFYTPPTEFPIKWKHINGSAIMPA